MLGSLRYFSAASRINRSLKSEAETLKSNRARMGPSLTGKSPLMVRPASELPDQSASKLLDQPAPNSLTFPDDVTILPLLSLRQWRGQPLPKPHTASSKHRSHNKRKPYQSPVFKPRAIRFSVRRFTGPDRKMLYHPDRGGALFSFVPSDDARNRIEAYASRSDKP